jgi:hypothetical protein
MLTPDSSRYIDDFLGHMRIPLPNMAKGLVAEGVHWADIDGDGKFLVILLKILKTC